MNSYCCTICYFKMAMMYLTIKCVSISLLLSLCCIYHVLFVIMNHLYLIPELHPHSWQWINWHLEPSPWDVTWCVTRAVVNSWNVCACTNWPKNTVWTIKTIFGGGTPNTAFRPVTAEFNHWMNVEAANNVDQNISQVLATSLAYHTSVWETCA